MDLTGKVALVTGAGQNIGLATAQLLARAGAAVAVNDVVPAKAERAAAAVEAAGGGALAVPADVRDRAAVAAMVERTVASLGRLDILVNSHGQGSFAPV